MPVTASGESHLAKHPVVGTDLKLDPRAWLVWIRLGVQTELDSAFEMFSRSTHEKRRRGIGPAVEASGLLSLSDVPLAQWNDRRWIENIRRLWNDAPVRIGCLRSRPLVYADVMRSTVPHLLFEQSIHWIL